VQAPSLPPSHTQKVKEAKHQIILHSLLGTWQAHKIIEEKTNI